MKQEEIKKTREFVSKVLRSWRGNLYLSGENYTDKELAELVGITPAAFSRLLNGTSTASLPVYHSILVKIIDTLGNSVMLDIVESCRSSVYEND